MPTTDNRRLYWLLLAALLVAAVCLRLLHLGDPSLWWDEFITLGTALLPVRRMLHTLTVIGPSDFGGEFFPPLYHLITRAVLTVTHDDAALRGISLVAGTATVAVMYGFIGEIFTRRAGLFAAALTTLCVYHIHYSRELRPYSLFTLLGLLSLWTLYRALNRGGLANYVAYAAATTAMCYSSSMGTTNIGAQGLFTAFFLLHGLISRELTPRQAIGKGLALAACVGVVGLCFLPWLPAYRNIFALLRQEKSPGIPEGFVVSVLTEFFAYAAPKRGLPWLPLALASLGGLGVAVAKPRLRPGLVLLALFALMPVAAFLLAGTKLEISSRYVFNALFALLALAGLGLDAGLDRIADYVGLSPSRRAFALPLAGLGCCLLLCAVDLSTLPSYYRRETSYNKELADYLGWNKNNVEYLFLQSNRNPKLITGWYLPGVYKTLAHYQPKGYKRAYHVIQSDLTPAVKPFPMQKVARFMDSAVYRLGLVSAAPVVLFPDTAGTARYVDKFHDYNFYMDCEEADNIAPESRYHTLTHYDYERPGHVLYRFVAASGTAYAAGRLSLDFSASFLEGIPSDSRVTIALAVGDGPLVALETLTGDAFLGPDGKLVAPNYEKRRFIHRDYPLPQAVAGASTLRLRIDYGPVANPGVIEVTGLELAATLTGRPTNADPAQSALERVAANNALAAWTPGQTRLDAALYAFPSRPDIPQGPANPVDALPGFLAEHPGLEPVLTIPGPDGKPAYVLYDPALSRPFVPLAEGRPTRLLENDAAPTEFASLKLTGALNRPRLAVAGRNLDIGVLAPSPSTLLLTRSGVGVLRFEPSFARESEALAAFPLAYNIRKNDDEDCLACRDAAPCSLTVPLSSAYPVKELRILSYPRIFADKAGKNRLTVSFSEDGTTFTKLDALVSNRSGHWEGLMVRRISVLRFKKPIHNGFVRFDFSGPGVQLWSRDDTPMRIEAVLDTSAFTGLPAPAGPFAVELLQNGGQPLSLFLTPEILPYRPDLQDNY
jgi:4-amino-4-deoxy-L-arabinose transferase-like glycosyltransferase